MVAARTAWRLAGAAAALALATCAAPEPSRSDTQRRAAPERLLVPLQVIAHARLAPAVDRTGLPSLRSGVAPLTAFVHPTAVAAAGNDLYVVDAGARRLYRLDMTLAAMALVDAAPVVPGMRIAVGHDFSLYVLDPPHRRVLRVSRDGRVIATYADSANLARPTALAVDDVHGQVIVADHVFNLLVAFHPLGGARQLIPMRGDERNRVMSIGAIALNAGAILVSDPLCRCVQVVDRGGVVRASFGHGELGQPGPLAADRHGRVFIVDQFANSLKIFAAGRLVHDAPAAALGLAQVTDLAVTEDRLVIVDGVGARIAMLRVAPPRTE